MALAPCLIASLNTSRGCTGAWLNPPIETVHTRITRFLVFNKMVRKCSRSSRPISKPSSWCTSAAVWITGRVPTVLMRVRRPSSRAAESLPAFSCPTIFAKSSNVAASNAEREGNAAASSSARHRPCLLSLPLPRINSSNSRTASAAGPATARRLRGLSLQTREISRTRVLFLSILSIRFAHVGTTRMGSGLTRTLPSMQEGPPRPNQLQRQSLAAQREAYLSPSYDPETGYGWPPPRRLSASVRPVLRRTEPVVGLPRPPDALSTNTWRSAPQTCAKQQRE